MSERKWVEWEQLVNYRRTIVQGPSSIALLINHGTGHSSTNDLNISNVSSRWMHSFMEMFHGSVEISINCTGVRIICINCELDVLSMSRDKIQSNDQTQQTVRYRLYNWISKKEIPRIELHPIKLMFSFLFVWGAINSMVNEVTWSVATLR